MPDSASVRDGAVRYQSRLKGHVQVSDRAGDISAVGSGVFHKTGRGKALSPGTTPRAGSALAGLIREGIPGRPCVQHPLRRGRAACGSGRGFRAVGAWGRAMSKAALAASGGRAAARNRALKRRDAVGHIAQGTLFVSSRIHSWNGIFPGAGPGRPGAACGSTSGDRDPGRAPLHGDGGGSADEPVFRLSRRRDHVQRIDAVCW
jgi:hypothetical protein